VLFEQFEGLLDEVSEDQGLSLSVLDLVSEVAVAGLEQVENGQDLSVVGHEGFTDGVGAEDQLLQDLQSNGNNFMVSGVQSGLNWDDQLRDNGEYLWATFFEHVCDTLDGEEAVGIVLFTDTFKEDRKVVMVIKLGNVNFPVNFVLRSVLDGNWQVSTVVESAEFTRRDVACLSGTSFGS